MNLKPCVRYIVVANHSKPHGKIVKQQWELDFVREEPIASCDKSG